MRYFLELRYNGAAYCGWQRQPDMPSVQQTLERALATLLREKIEVTGAGRTDTGVNASYYVAHFDCAAPAPHVDQRPDQRPHHVAQETVGTDRKAEHALPVGRP